MDRPAFSIIGVIHLLPLPGAPRASPGMEAVIERALRDAEALLLGGIRTVIVENLGDAPFAGGAVGPHVPACMAAVCSHLNRSFHGALDLGINVLRNDPLAALGVAVACGASFIRINVHVGAAWTDQGLIQGRAHETLRARRELVAGGSPIRIAADVLVKHAVPAGAADLVPVARETAERGGADVLILTGRHTGGRTDLSKVTELKDNLPGVPVWVGSGVKPEQAGAVLAAADGAIVGTWLHEEGRLDRPLDPGRIKALVAAFRVD